MLSSTGTAVGLPLASEKTSGLSAGCSRPRATRMPSIPSFVSRKVTLPFAARVVTRSIARLTASAWKEKRVVSSSATAPPGITQSARTSRSPRPTPPREATTSRWRMTPIFARSAGGIASELPQKSTPSTSPNVNQYPAWWT